MRLIFFGYLARQEAYINQHIALARPTADFYSDYVGYFLVATNHGQRKFQKEGKGATKSGLRLDDVRTVKIPVLSIDRQREIVRRIESLFALADRIEEKLASLTERVGDLPQAILAKAFRGEL
jgi:type I restriction enzyme S subunit